MDLQRSDIERMEMLLIDGIKNRDIGFLEKTIHDDLLCLAPDGSIITKQMDLDAHRAGAMVVEKLAPKQGEINIIGDTAVSIIIYDTRGKMMGNPIEGRFRYIRVWKKFNDGLKVIAASFYRV